MLFVKQAKAQQYRLSAQQIFVRFPLAIVLAAVFSGGIGISGVALAQTAGGAESAGARNSVELETVRVTAQKREESAQEVPSAITVLSGDDLIDQGIGRSASEILNYVPNASAATQQHGRPRWWIRGVGAGQQQHDLANPVGFYLDEVYISNASATGFPLFDLERVEVLRGPQGTLWGKNTTGGAISVLSRKPEFGLEGPTGYAKVDYGSYNTLLLEGAVGAEISADALAARVSFHSENQNKGRFRNEFTGKKEDELRDDALRLQLLAKVSPNFEALLNVHRREYKTEGTTWTIVSYNADGSLHRPGSGAYAYTPGTGRDEVNANDPAQGDTVQNGVALNLKWQLGRLTLTSITGYENFSLESQGGDYTPLELSRSYGDDKSRQWSQEFRLSSPREDKVSWVTGLHYFKENIDAYSATANNLTGVPAAVPPSGALQFSDTKYSHSARSFALFGSARVNWTDNFDTVFGLRWTKETKEADIRRRNTQGAGSVTFGNVARWWDTALPVFPASDGNFDVSQKKTWKKWTWDITPEYRFSDNLRGFFKYAHGIKSGGFNTSATDIEAVNVVEPETLDSYELGLKSEWFNRRLIFNATLFHYQYDDVQVNVVGPKAFSAGTSVSYLQNVEKAHVNGLELEAEALPSANLHLRGSLGLLKTKFDKFEIRNGGGFRDGNEFVRSPHLTAQLAVDYRIPFANGGSLLLGGDYRHTSKQYYYVAQQKPSQYSNRTVKHLGSDPYGILNLRAAYSTPSGNQTLTFYINNATDEEYIQHALPGGTFTDGNSITQGPRRTFGISYITRF
ncbi:MAG: TonB-dependent receptor [Zoogloeaceae bacterium]|jgi:iron complex outermembrane receptor protein|nr:TonB-dependent receptor [Zoogloeaceae bacterium]